MSVNIKRSLWEKLSFIDDIDFYPYHKGVEISWSLVGDKTLSKSEEEKLEDDLGNLQSGRLLQSGKHLTNPLQSQNLLLKVFYSLMQKIS